MLLLFTLSVLTGAEYRAAILRTRRRRRKAEDYGMIRG